MDLSLWSSGEQAAGTALRTGLLYVIAVVAARLAGRRTLARLSGFDMVVTVAIGTLVASSALPPHPAVSDGVAALATLLALQVVIAALRQRFARLQRWIDFRPEVVLREEQFHLPHAPWTAQLTRSDLESRLREQGIDQLSPTMIVVLEPGGRFSVAQSTEPGGLFDEAHRSSISSADGPGR